MKNKTMVEFFSGEGSLAKAFEEEGYDVFTIDNNPKNNPSLCTDILSLKLDMIPEKFRNPDVAHFGVPCTKFSVAGRKSNFINHMPTDIDSCIALALVYKCLELIEEMKPKNFFIENPVGYLRTFPFMKKLCRKEVWYCRYKDEKKRTKPTDFFTNRADWVTKKCFNNNPNCDHARAPRGSKSGTQGLPNAYERGTYPKELCREIVMLCENKLKVKQNTL